MPHILIADDDVELCRLLSDYLQLDDFQVSCAHSGDAALQQCAQQRYDLLVLDIMLPGMQGLDVLRELRHGGNALPVIMLTARGDETDRIVGLELGADDYLPKPCNPRELSARIRAVLRRSDSDRKPQADIHYSNLALIQEEHRAYCEQQPLPLTETEYELLREMLQCPEQALGKEDLSQRVLGRPLSSYDRSLDMHVSNLRRKLRDSGCEANIETVRGFGYRLCCDQSGSESV